MVNINKNCIAKYKTIENLIEEGRIKLITPTFKVKKNEYNNSGKTPIVSQEEELISGYCDLIDEKIPNDKYICFGDHSEHIKYVDFSFVQGADGLKILKVKDEEIDTKYLFYVLLNNYKKHNNYERHFKYLIKTCIPIPLIEEQREIVSILDDFSKVSEELSIKLMEEIKFRQKQYEYYRDKLLTFKELKKEV